MLNAFAASFRLTTHQLLGGRRRGLTLVAYLLPVGLAVLARMILPAKAFADPTVGYAAILIGVYVGVFVPFMAVYWGAAVMTDEIEGKTLVYLWTRPAGRARLMTMKYLVAMAWLIALTSLSLTATFLVLSWSSETPLSAHHLLTIAWDVRALGLGALAYGSLAFLFSGLFKKPLMLSLLYVYVVDLLGAILPGYLKLVSVRHYVVTLTTQKLDEGEGRLQKKLLELVDDASVTENQAVWTLIAVAAVFLVFGALLLRSREFLADDPARER